MMSKSKLIYGAALILVAGITVWSLAGAEASVGMAVGEVELQSVGALELGPENILFVGDSEGARIVALEVDFPAPSGEPFEAISDLDEKIGAMLGVGARDVFIKDMVVHQSSGATFLSVMRGSGDEARPILLSVARDGKIAEVPLTGVRHSTLELDDAPDAEGEPSGSRARSCTMVASASLCGCIASKRRISTSNSRSRAGSPTKSGSVPLSTASSNVPIMPPRTAPRDAEMAEVSAIGTPARSGCSVTEVNHAARDAIAIQVVQRLANLARRGISR